MNKMFASIFIGGTGRSGTNIVCKAIGRHKNVTYLPFEPRVWVDPLGVLPFLYEASSIWTPFIAEARINRLEHFLKGLSHRKASEYWWKMLTKTLHLFGFEYTKKQYSGWQLSRHFPNYDTHIEELISGLTRVSYEGRWVGSETFQKPNIRFFRPGDFEQIEKSVFGFIENMIQDICVAQETSCFVADDTWNIVYAKSILEGVQNSKFIHVIRDPRDVVTSLLQQRWAPSDLEKAINFYADIMDCWLKCRDELPSERFLEVKLEDIVENPQKEFGDMLALAGLEFDSAVANLDLSKSNKGRWKVDLGNDEKKYLSSKLETYIELFNY